MSRTFAQGSRCCNFVSFTPFIDCDPEPGNWEKLSWVVCLNKCLVCMCSHFPLCIWRDEMGNHSNSWTTLFKTIEKHPRASCENWGTWYASPVVYCIICVTTLSIFKRGKKNNLMNLNCLIQHRLTSCFCSFAYISFAIFCNSCMCCFVDLALWWVTCLCAHTFNSCVGFYSNPWSPA